MRIYQPVRGVGGALRENSFVMIDDAGVEIGQGGLEYRVIKKMLPDRPLDIEMTMNAHPVASDTLFGALSARAERIKDEEGGLPARLYTRCAIDDAERHEYFTRMGFDDFDGVDIIQIGARNMQNFELLKEVGRLDTPVLLKRGLVNTVDELLLSAEYVMSEGNKNVILCERGIRTFETLTRNTLDLGVIPLLKEFTHLPVIVDPSHASGLKRLVSPLSLASAAVSADGVMIEVHNDPEHALCDGAQAVKPEEFAEIVKKTEGILSICGNKRVER